MCLGVEGTPTEKELPIYLPDMEVGRVVRRYSIYSHFYFLEITFPALASGTVFSIIVKEDLCPSFTYPAVRPGDIIRVSGNMEPTGKCFEATEIEHFGKWDFQRYGVFQYKGAKLKTEKTTVAQYEERKLALAIQCQADVVDRVQAYLISKIGPDGFDVEESTTPISVSQDRLLLVWKRKSGSRNSGAKISKAILADPVLRYAISRLYNFDKHRTYTGLCPAEALCELFNCTNIENESHRIRIHAFPKFVDLSETFEVMANSAPNVIFTPTNYTHVMVVIYANGAIYLSYMEKELAIGCGQYVHQDSNLECLSVSKAAAKILEATCRMTNINSLVGKTALDIGAAPGGWSYYLRKVAGCARVIAVDMGALAAPIPAGVEHWQMKGEDAVEKLLSQEDKIFLFDIYTCDMNVTPLESVELFKSAIPLMAKKSVAILTLKRTVKNKTKWNELKSEAIEILKNCDRVVCYEEIHLIANTPNETTVLVTLD